MSDPKKGAFIQYQTLEEFPRLLLGASIDLTYRCNNKCHHCWLWMSADAPEADQELSADDIHRISEEARTLGVQEWTISGGEPMLRPDFAEIFNDLTSKVRTYTLKTNGTLITPQIARILARPGEAWISIYGATADVHDRVVRRAGAFEDVMRGIALLKEAGARFVIQIFPMRENWHQWPQMIELASRLNPHWRLGAAWLNLCADGNPRRNSEIAAQRLDSDIVVALDKPSMIEESEEPNESRCKPSDDGSRLLGKCLASRREVHIDPYGGMSICGVVKDPGLRYDLKQGSLREGWEVFIPSLADKVQGSEEYQRNCGPCQWRADCLWCPTYAYLEHRDPSAKVEYLCSIARETRRYKDNWLAHHRRFFQIGGITIQVDSDLPILDTTFSPALAKFQVETPGPELVKIRHHFSLQGINLDFQGEEAFRQGPWTVYRRGNSWIYRCSADETVYSIAVVSDDHSRGTIYHANDQYWLQGGSNTLSFKVTDQILLSRLLADRQGCILHSAGAIFNGRGLLFIGHAEAGKTTITRLLEGRAEILCDDRNIVRRYPEGYRIFGTWSHGDSPVVSASSAPLQAALFLRQSTENRLERLTDRKEIARRVIACLIRALLDRGWWNKTLDFIEFFAREVPCYELLFEKQGDIVSLLRDLRE